MIVKLKETIPANSKYVRWTCGLEIPCKLKSVEIRKGSTLIVQFSIGLVVFVPRLEEFKATTNPEPYLSDLELLPCLLKDKTIFPSEHINVRIKNKSDVEKEALVFFEFDEINHDD